jgi:signal transduction histidine kinase
MIVVVAATEFVLRPELQWRALSLAMVVGLAPTLLWRRTRPFVAVAVAFVPTILTSLVMTDAPDMYTAVYFLLLPYALLRWGSGREIVGGVAIILGKMGLALGLGQLTVTEAVGGSIVLGASMTLGLAVRFRAGAKGRELEQVRLLERERLARDLHDTVAHHVSAIAVRAQAGLATAPTDPEAATNALRVIEAEASRALAEMRGMVRVLRHDDRAERAPQPRVADLEQLRAQALDGPRVSVAIDGDTADLPPPVQVAIFRLAQESVTNARRHAHRATRIDVRVAADDRAVHLRVSDDGEPVAVRATTSSGYGLAGMAERAGLLGGTCQAGPNPDRGWTVTATLPRAGAGATV